MGSVERMWVWIVLGLGFALCVLLGLLVAQHAITTRWAMERGYERDSVKGLTSPQWVKVREDAT